MIALCLGRREMGKTTLALYLARQAALQVLFDPRGLMPAAARVTGSTAQIVDRFNLAWEVEPQGGQIVITPERHLQVAFEQVSAETKRWLKEPHAPPVALVIDELRFIDPRAEDFDWLLRCATRASITIVLTAHRPVDVSPDIRAIADLWCIFQTTQEHDLRVIEERCTDDVVHRVQRLKPREFIAWDDTKAEARVYTDPTVWYRPLTTTHAAGVPTKDAETLPPGDALSVNQRSLI